MKLSVHGVAAGVADYIRSHSHALMVRPWAWTPTCPPETRNDTFESLLQDDANGLRTFWDLDELLRDYVSRHGSR